jgi:hypothetical protein
MTQTSLSIKLSIHIWSWGRLIFGSAGAVITSSLLLGSAARVEAERPGRAIKQLPTLCGKASRNFG